MQKIKPLLKIAPKQVPKMTYLCVLCQRWINILTTPTTTKKKTAVFSHVINQALQKHFLWFILYSSKKDFIMQAMVIGIGSGNYKITNDPQKSFDIPGKWMVK